MPIYLPSGGALTQAAIIAALSTDPVFEGMAQFTSLGTPGEYTLAKSGIVVKNAADDEVLRIWASDPDENNFNGLNLYIGPLAGAGQPTNNVDAGFFNVGVGAGALFSVSTGHSNTGVGVWALYYVTTGSANVGVGHNALTAVTSGNGNVVIGFDGGFIEEGSNNVAIGSDLFNYTGPTSDLSNTTCLGSGAQATASNRVVLGNADVLDAYFGSESAAANTHQKRVFIVGTTAPADGDLAANQCALWFDPTDGAAKLMVKAKQADGSVKTGAVDVTT